MEWNVTHIRVIFHSNGMNFHSCYGVCSVTTPMEWNSLFCFYSAQYLHFPTSLKRPNFGVVTCHVTRNWWTRKKVSKICSWIRGGRRSGAWGFHIRQEICSFLEGKCGFSGQHVVVFFSGKGADPRLHPPLPTHQFKVMTINIAYFADTSHQEKARGKLFTP